MAQIGVQQRGEIWCAVDGMKRLNDRDFASMDSALNYVQGWLDCMANSGVSFSRNPFAVDSESARLWDMGFSDSEFGWTIGGEVDY